MHLLSYPGLRVLSSSPSRSQGIHPTHLDPTRGFKPKYDKVLPAPPATTALHTISTTGDYDSDQHDDAVLGPTSVSMEDTSLAKLTVRLSGMPTYMYCHLGCCEHLVQVMLRC
jgi:hypothetical protein